MSNEKTWSVKIREVLQWGRVPLMTAFVVTGIYLIHTQTYWLWIGMVVTLFGEFMQLWAASHLKKDKALATSGPYSHVRNPMYFGRFFVLLGFIIMIQQAWWAQTLVFNIPLLVVGYVVIFAIYVNGRVGREEARLRGIFGEDYIHYCNEVPRFFPKLRPYSRSAKQNWQWARIIANHEYLNMVAAVFVFGLIIVRIRYLGF